MQQKEDSALPDKSGYQLIDGVYMLQRPDFNPWFEEQYSTKGDPWSYNRRGGELYRHTFTVEQLRKFCPYPSTLLELGCSRGLMTAQLTPFTKELYASDISPSAVKACKQQCDALAKQHDCSMHYYVTTTPGLPFADDSFEVVTLCDGLIGWWFSEEQKQEALQDTYRVLRKGGYAVFTDYTTPDNFANCIKLIEESKLSVVSVSYLFDKPWYVLESVVKKLPGNALLRPLVASPAVAKFLHLAGRAIGPVAARHIAIVARKE